MDIVSFVKDKGRITNKELNDIKDRTVLRDIEKIIELNIFKNKERKKALIMKSKTKCRINYIGAIVGQVREKMRQKMRQKLDI